MSAVTRAIEHRFAVARRSATVLAGFSVLVMLMAAIVADSTRQFKDITSRSAGLRRDYARRDALLDELRTNIYRASTLMRDYAFATDAASAGTLRTELEGIRIRDRSILADYGRLLQDPERQSYEALETVEAAYSDGILSALDANEIRGQRDRQTFFRESVLPHRRELISLVSQVNALDQRDNDAGEERLQDLHFHFQQRVASLSLIALALSAVLGFVVVLRTRYLERQAENNLAQAETARRDLSLLSNSLVNAQEEERRNLSRELHDQVGQSMTAMLIDLGRLESRLAGLQNVQGIIASIRRSAEENVARIRDLSLLLRPSMLDELGLVPALRWQAREVTRRSGLKVRMTADDFDEELSDDYRTCVYRIVQEALHNCVKHAHATEARVVINRDRDALYVSVQDNGVGFDPGQQKGLGLLGIEERAARLGGVVCVQSRRGEGAVLSVRFPLPSAAETALQAGAA
jgi:signal transduction histidine kinase